MARLDLLRQAFDMRMVEYITAAFVAVGKASKFQWLGINSPVTPDLKKTLIRSNLVLGRVDSVEMAGTGKPLGQRAGVYTIMQSIAEGTAIDPHLQIAALLEDSFGHTEISVDGGCVVCDAPYTENVGTSAQDGRYVITTYIPWTMIQE